ncbi:MAG: hypothetical protein QOJ45_1017 [Verrucomicrobiota bacterium]|jgi:uncharacterized protein (TIGR03790 family)
MQFRSRLKLFVVICLALSTRLISAEIPLAPVTIVVFNKDVPESIELAKYYAKKRGIAADHLVGLTCSKAEEISRDEYDLTIRDPLRAIFQEKKWWTLHEVRGGQTTIAANSIRFVALIKGMPLKIRAATNYPGDKPGDPPITNRNDAAVDSELAALGAFSSQISGALTNPYFQSYRAITDLENPPLMLVCRLDAPSGATVRRMIDDAFETEKTGLWGRAFVDGAHNTGQGLGVGDSWLAEIPGQLHKAGIPVIYDDSPELFPDGYPMSDCALYFGWYAGEMAGPFTQPDFRFVPGAIAVHIHSYSASTLKYDNERWAGPLLSKGAAGTIGNVYEPYLQLTSHLNVFSDRLLHGFTFAESAYMSVQTLSWMSVMVGDPLYRPYAAWLRIEEKPEAGKSSSDWKAYHEFATKNGSRPAAEYRAQARQFAARTRNAPMLEDLGLMEAAAGNFAIASVCFDQARTIYTKRDDILRAIMHEANALAKDNKPKRGLDLVRSALRIVSDAPASALLKKLEMELRAAKPAATPVNVRRP